jgi:hypothetical protein
LFVHGPGHSRKEAVPANPSILVSTRASQEGCGMESGHKARYRIMLDANF